MKRDSRGTPVVMIHRWSQPLSSCSRCREKKQRCDRNQPCSNCKIRNINCEYASQSQSGDLLQKSKQPLHPKAVDSGGPAASNVQTAIRPEFFPLNNEELLHRVRKLEEAVFCQTTHGQTPLRAPAIHDSSNTSLNFTLFNSHSSSTSSDEPSLRTSWVVGNLPPIRQARVLFNHYALIVHPSLGIHHLPSTRDLMEQTYQSMMDGEEPSDTNILLHFSIFAGAALSWTPQLLDELKCTQGEAKAAFTVYTRLAMSIVDDDDCPLGPSTVALEAISSLAHLLSNSSGLPDRVYVLRMRCLSMARTMNIHRLDTAKSREERKLKGCNMIEIEVQRRVWWSMVAFDWLSAFSGGVQEGAYIFQKKHMNVDYPSNVDDESITPTGVPQSPSFSTPTSMSAFICRLYFAEVCREVVDKMPSIFLDVQEIDYSAVLELDRKFNSLLENLPKFFLMDPGSIQESGEICKERPDIAWQRFRIHFSLHSRLCRLHRPYHLEGSTNPKYAYSHSVCIRSAQTVLELRRAMDEVDTEVGGLKPARSWWVMEHVFLAALVLATDFSFNPNAPDAEARKAKVMATYGILEKSKQESSALTERIQRNMQTLLSTLQKQRSEVPGSLRKASSRVGNDPYSIPSEAVSAGQPGEEMGNSSSSFDDEIRSQHQTLLENSSTSFANGTRGNELSSEAVIDPENFDKLWSEFLAISGDLDGPQWNSLLDNTDFEFQPDIL